MSLIFFFHLESIVRGGDRYFICWFILQMDAAIRAASGQSQEAITLARSPMHEQRTGVEVVQLGLELALMNVNVVGSGSELCATTPTPLGHS